MSSDYSNEPMLEVYIFETVQMIEQLEQKVLNSEKDGFEQVIDEIFRIMHSIKSASSMMLFDNIAHLSHSLEDLFDYFRSNRPKYIDFSAVTDIVLNVVDFLKNEMSKIESNKKVDGNSTELIEVINNYLFALKGSKTSSTLTCSEIVANDYVEEQKYYISPAKIPVNLEKENRYQATLYFDEDCQAENLRAFTIMHGLKDLASDIITFPEDLIDNNSSVEMIKKEGFKIYFNTERSLEELRQYFSKDAFIKNIELNVIGNEPVSNKSKGKKQIILDESEFEPTINQQCMQVESDKGVVSTKQSAINVNVTKLDALMDLVGELVISEAMVTHNPDLAGLSLENFYKSASHLRKITNELQDIVMSIRMVPISTVFQKMHRIVRDMGRKLNKEVQLELIGEETEVDKSIIENISDPLIHLIRNSMDHGIETPDERLNNGKEAKGKVTLEAKNSGGEVWIIVNDDGRGLSKDKLLKEAKENGLLTKLESEMTEKEIYSLIFLPGFSTKESVTEFSGRGVGMDVVMKNIEKVRGSVIVDSILGQGTTISIRIPLTLAIIDGMNIEVGTSKYTIPMTSIKESFRATESNIIRDTEENEMIMVRGECYPILRLNKLYNVKTQVASIDEGIILMVEDGGKVLCLFADSLLGVQQVVVKVLPKYIKKVRGVAGCTLLGDGSISLILDVTSLINN